MNLITLRISDREKMLIENYAKVNSLNVSELMRQAVLEKIESDIDLTIYNQAIGEHKKNPQDISFDEMVMDLGLED